MKTLEGCEYVDGEHLMRMLEAADDVDFQVL